MLPASKRLSRTEFSSVFAAGRRFHSEHLTVIYAANSPTAASVVVSKKVAKLAVVRNRLRRRAYTLLRPRVVTMPTGAYIVLYKAGSALIPRRTLATELSELLAKIEKAR